MDSSIAVFEDRHSSGYKNFLETILSHEGENGLIQTAVSIDTPRIHQGTKYHKCVRIDFCGMAASMLFKKDEGNATVAHKFLELFQKLPEINSQGIFVKVRFLFGYLYSDFSFSLIKAEKSSRRATIQDKKFTAGFELEEELIEQDFYGSAAYRNQIKALELIQKIGDNYNLFDSDSLNYLQVRFTPISLNTCSLIVNDKAVSDCYLYSREDFSKDSLANCYPVICIHEAASEHQFDSVNDSFRYLWNHQTTLYAKDATYFEPGVANSLKRIRKPYSITLDHKATRLLELERASNNGLNDVDIMVTKKVVQWKFLVKQRVLHSTKIFNETRSTESIFLACSWEVDAAGASSPNKYAKMLEKYLQEDFEQNNDIKLVVTRPTERLFEKIYTFLRQSTLGIIIITRDVESADGKYYFRPNIYFEQGYLVSHLDSRRTERVLTLVERQAIPPTNSDDVGYIKFESDLLQLRYGKIIGWIKDKCETVGSEQIVNATTNHSARLVKMLQEKNISADAYAQLMSELECFR